MTTLFAEKWLYHDSSSSDVRAHLSCQNMAALPHIPNPILFAQVGASREVAQETRPMVGGRNIDMVRIWDPFSPLFGQTN
jgi:hypothetical protein